MGHWQSFYEILLDYLTPPIVGINRVIDTSWINSYGNAAVDIRYDQHKITFIFDGDNDKKYVVEYILNRLPDHAGIVVNTASRELTTYLSPFYNSGLYPYDYIYVTQHKEYTPSGSNPLHWELAITLNGSDSGVNYLYVSVQPVQTTTSSPITTSRVQPLQLFAQKNVPRIQVTILPEGSFQDIASVTFSIENVQENIGCVKSDYKQLLSPGVNTMNEGQHIHVLAPLITCYLTGTGDFATEKMYSMNKTVGPVWPEVFLYAMTKFILHRLLTDVFDMDILYRRNTKTFLRQLEKSDYSNFLQYFSQNTDKERYFLR